MSGKKTRIQVSISPKLLESLDRYCDEIGVSRSAFIQTTLGQTLYGITTLQKRVSESVVSNVEKTEAGATYGYSDLLEEPVVGPRPVGL